MSSNQLEVPGSRAKMGSEMKQEYEALRHGAAILMRPDAPPLSLRGQDRADLLHRMTTNDIAGLRAGQAAVTVLTTPTAHIQFVFTVLCREDDLLLLPASGHSETLSSHLRGQIFFMDQVEVSVLDHARCRIMGPNAENALSGAGLLPEPSVDDTWWSAGDATFVRQDRFDIPGFEVVAARETCDRIADSLIGNGAIRLTGVDAYNARRVELGIPAPGHELTDQHNPLEVGLEWACSDHKGCYTGQEIIARQITYDKVTKRLVGLTCQAEVMAGDSVTTEGKSVGQITSAAYSPQMHAYLALAVIRRPHNVSGTPVTVQHLERQTEVAEPVEAHVSELPFE